MASERDNAPLSDTEGGEKPVREQLRKAHITTGPSASQSSMPPVDPSSEHGNGQSAFAEEDERGRLHRKRSDEEIEQNGHTVPQDPAKNHTRKRSRDSTFEEDQLNNGQRKVSGERARPADEPLIGGANGETEPSRPVTPEQSGEKRSESAVEAMTSPKTKRSRLHSKTTEEATELRNEVHTTSTADTGEADRIAGHIVRDTDDADAKPKESGTAAKVPSTGGFANTAAASPFGSLAGSKSPSTEVQTSSSAFAASGFGALSGSSTSGFGAVGKQTGGFGRGGSFATGAKSTGENETTKSPPASSFGGSLGAPSVFSTAATSGSGFGSSASGFGKIGSGGGFGSALGGSGFSSLGGGGLTSFASGKAVTPLGGSSRPAKPFGALADDDAEAAGEDDPSGAKSPLATEEDKQDERFYEQELETGEEDEVVEFSARAKLYNFAPGEDGKKEWRERGLGVLRFNVKKADPDQASKPRGRLLMRADGSHRVVLNTPVLKEIKFGAAAGGPPQGGYMYFMGTIDGKDGLELLQLKMKQANALDLHSQITALQEEM